VAAVAAVIVVVATVVAAVVVVIIIIVMIPQVPYPVGPRFFQGSHEEKGSFNFSLNNFQT